MKKTVVLTIALAMVAAVIAGPALAGKKSKTITEDWTATNPVLYPVSFVGQGSGCQEGEEGLTKTSHAFTAPGPGILEVTLDNFEGDWDLFVFSGDAQLAASDAGQVISGAPTGERIVGIPLRPKQEVTIVACNWLGGPTADAHLTYTHR